MTDKNTMQRYEAYISSICECGCGEAMDDAGDYVLYSAHKAEVLRVLEQVNRNVIANFRGNAEGLYNVNGFINSIKADYEP